MSESQLDAQALGWALEKANLPTLLMSLYHLTGDDRWLQAPYRPARPRGIDENDSGGLPDDVQAEIRAQARSIIMDWAHGRAVAVPDPSGPKFVAMLEATMGEEGVPPVYGELMREDMGLVGREGEAGLIDRAALGDDFGVTIIGAGLSGLLLSLRLRDHGIPFQVLERNEDVGGVWHENDYPGAGVDTPAYLYSFGFYPRDWSRYFPRRAEILQYISDFADDHGLREHIRFGATVLSATFDEHSHTWAVRYRDADGTRERRSAIVVSAVGIFGTPTVPAIKGRDRFGGRSFHSAQWPSDLSIEGKDVVVIGTGASAMQVVPSTAEDGRHVTVMQRSPQWVVPAPKIFERVPDEVHWLMTHVPYYRQWYRARLAWMFNDKLHPTLRVDPDWAFPDRSVNETNDRHRQRLTAYIEAKVQDPEMLKKVIPDYPPYGRRMLMDHGWFDALARPNVTLAPSCAEVVEGGAIDVDGQFHPADVIVYCTGFDVARFVASFDVVGRGGRTLREVWGEDDARAYLGMMAPNFPNLFFMYGPATNSGSGGSFLSLAEQQVRYILDMLGHLSRRADEGVRAVAPLESVTSAYNDAMDRIHREMIWTHPRTDSYYRNASGRVVVNRPWTVAEYWDLLRRVSPEDYQWSSGSVHTAGSAARRA